MSNRCEHGAAFHSMNECAECEEALRNPPPRFFRHWCMPNANTFEIAPIAALLDRVLAGRAVVVDPFARGSKRATHGNDLNPEFCARPMEAQDFLRDLAARGVVADALLLDPPYSPRQMVEVYKSVGLDKGSAGSQNARLLEEVHLVCHGGAHNDTIATVEHKTIPTQRGFL